MRRSNLPPAVRAALKRLGNPYVFDQLDDHPQELSQPLAKSGAASQSQRSTERSTVASTQADLFSSAVTTIDSAPSGNPYRYVDASDRSVAAPAARARKWTESISRADFESGCRRIFSQYIPAMERGRLRPEHRDFIERNKGRTGRARSQLLAFLNKYDLSQLSLQPQFNRESGSLTAQKLNDIEKAVGEDE